MFHPLWVWLFETGDMIQPLSASFFSLTFERAYITFSLDSLLWQPTAKELNLSLPRSGNTITFFFLVPVNSDCWNLYYWWIFRPVLQAEVDVLQFSPSSLMLQGLCSWRRQCQFRELLPSISICLGSNIIYLIPKGLLLWEEWFPLPHPWLLPKTCDKLVLEVNCAVILPAAVCWLIYSEEIIL